MPRASISPAPSSRASGGCWCWSSSPACSASWARSCCSGACCCPHERHVRPQGWLANATLFTLSYVHVPLMLPRASSRRSSPSGPRAVPLQLAGAAVRAGECAGLLLAALMGILMPSWGPCPSRQPFLTSRGVHRGGPQLPLPTRDEVATSCSSATSSPSMCARATFRRWIYVPLPRTRRASCSTTAPSGPRRAYAPRFDPKAVLRANANPGLSVHQLHAQGVTGVAWGSPIIDSLLLVDHQEYERQLRWYEELRARSTLKPSFQPSAHMHAPGVASLASAELWASPRTRTSTSSARTWRTRATSSGEPTSMRKASGASSR